MRIIVSPRPTPVAPKPVKRRRRRFERASQPRGVQRTQRDDRLLERLALHRALSAEQIRRLCFPNTGERRVRRRLLTLYDHGLIDRIPVVSQPSRHVPPYLYTLGREGARAIATELGGPVAAPPPVAGGLRHVLHHVTVCEFFVVLSEAIAALNDRTRGGGFSLRKWQHEWELKVTDADGQRKAERVSVRDPESGQQCDVTVLPDAFFELARPQGPSVYFFGEIDLSTHSQRVWRDRALAFAAYDAGGLFRRRFGGGARESFRLLIVTPPDYRGRSRRQNILRTIEQTVGASDLFWVATLDELGVWKRGARSTEPHDPTRLLTANVWTQPGSAERHAIIGRAVRVLASPRPTAPN